VQHYSISASSNTGTGGVAVVDVEEVRLDWGRCERWHHKVSYNNHYYSETDLRMRHVGRGLTLERFKVCLSVWSGPVRSVPIEFPRKCISVNPRNCTYAFPRRCIITDEFPRW
jgi:hypothetical protein